MERSAIEKIEELCVPNIHEEYGYVYSDKHLYVLPEPHVNTLTFHTLDGLVNSLLEEYKDFNGPLLIDVRDEETVAVYSSISCADRQREIPYEVRAEIVEIPFNRKLDYETMMITLKSKFVETPELLELVKLLGTITEENSATASDDGFTQTVVVRKGIMLHENKAVNPIRKLKPYRTFNEVDQPESEFLLRLSEGGGVALYEADGGAWKLQARRNVAEYLKNALANLVEAGEVIIVE
ncbi:hypothetical protein [Ruminococcus sp.]|uniref:hypothetical protein n=1 Tax=Ruminococcus sp. TaxID=41978 RepID=UPI001B708DA4|nr:hypothetical protein [Ruminococcus sp.]MBP5431037.1 hypothetical protein [Ruminococcus sp.]